MTRGANSTTVTGASALPRLGRLSSGSDETQLGFWGHFNVPSRALHNGHRWFLTWPESDPIQYMPNGGIVQETWAVRSDGASGGSGVVSVQLTDDPSLHLYNATWMPGDSGVAWIGRRFDEGGNVVEMGLYTATLL